MNICIHYIIACRQRHPKTIIWLAIQDYKSAYCRTHLHPEVSVKSMTPFPSPTLDMVIMVLRMTFGGKPNASEWGCISETVTDLANKLLVCDSWDPSTLYSLLQNKIPPRKTLDSNIPFAPAYSTMMSPIPSLIGPVTFQSFCFDNLRVTRTLMETKSNKRQSLPFSPEHSPRINRSTTTLPPVS